MTENEAKIFIQNAMEQSKNVLKERAWVSITVIWRTAKKKFSHVK